MAAWPLLPLLLGIFSLADGQSCGTNCGFTLPNRCPPGTIVQESTSVVFVGTGCPNAASCCVPASSCEVASGKCCTRFQSLCSVCSASTATAPLSLAPSRCLVSNTTSRCPPNFVRQSVVGFYGGTCNFCIDPNCETVSGTDCTQCLSCRAESAFVSDGSCQPLPAIQAVLSQPARGRTASLCELGPLSLATSPGMASTQLTLNFSMWTSANNSNTGSRAGLSSVLCTLNGTTLTSTASGAISFNLTLGAHVLRCVAVDTNGLSRNCTRLVSVLDLEPPQLRCTDVVLSPTAGSNWSQFNWSASVASQAAAPAVQGTLRRFCDAVSFTMQSVWMRGFVANVFLSNYVPVTTISWTWSSSTTISSVWNAALLQSSPTSATVQTNFYSGNPFSFQASTAANAQPVAYDFVINGQLCNDHSVFVPLLPPRCPPLSFSVQSVWATGLSIEVNIDSDETPSVVEWLWSSPASVVNVWNAELTSSSTMGARVTTTLYGANDFGFQIAFAATVVPPRPMNFTINGIVCSDPAASTSSPTTVPTFSTANAPSSVSLSDNVAAAFLNCSGGPRDNRFFAGQTRLISCTAWDTSLNNATCSYSVRVADTTPPVIVCPASAWLPTATGLSSATHAWVLNASDDVQVYNTSCQPDSGSSFALGNTTVSCSAVDTSGNRATCAFSVVVRDLEPPIIQCPLGNISVSASTQSAFSDWMTIPNIQVSDNSGGTVYTECVPGGFPSPYSFPMGRTPVLCSARDVAGNTASCSLGVVVRDTSPPVITTCAPSILSALPGLNYSTLASDVAFSAVDNVGVTMQDCTPSNLGGARQWPIGATPVSCFASDAAGNRATCNLTITVQDTQPPQVTCPTSAVFNTSQPSGFTATFHRPRATDNARLNSTVLSVFVSGAEIPLSSLQESFVFAAYGAATFSFRATDTSNNMQACHWTITLIANTVVQQIDNVAPNITNCPTPFLLSRVPSSSFNDFNSSFFTYNLTTLPGRRVATVAFPLLTASDANGLLSSGYLDWSPTATTAALAGFEPGRYVVAYGAMDPIGNAAYCVFRVLVTDSEPPRYVNCPPNAQYVSRNTSAVRLEHWPSGGLVAQDNVFIANPFGSCVSQPSGWCPPAGGMPTALFPVGFYRFAFTAVDSSGNEGVCRFNVTVIDTAPPSFRSCQSTSVRVVAPLRARNASIAHLCPSLDAVDNVGVVSTTVTSIPPGYNCNTPVPVSLASGVILKFTVQDQAGYKDDCELFVVVEDREPPVLVGCQADQLVTLSCDAGMSTAGLRLPVITASDNSGTVTLSSLSVPAGLVNGSRLPVGHFVTTITARDPANNTAQCVFRIVVSDNEPPRILGLPFTNASGPNSVVTLTLQTDAGQPTASFRLPNLTAVDNVAVVSAGFVSAQYVPLQTYDFPRGQTLLTFTATDSHRNSATATLLVNVVDREAPVFIDCPAARSPFVANTSAGLPTAVVDWGNVLARDNVDGALVRLTQLSTPAGYVSGSRFPIGTTSVLYTATDSSGNSASCAVSVQVVDLEPPQLLCPSNMQVFLPQQVPQAFVAWREPLVTDNNLVEAVAVSRVPGLFGVGSYDVTYTASDVAGNAASCTFTFEVLEALQGANTATVQRTSELPSYVYAVVGGAGGLLLVVVLLIGLLIRYRRRANKVQAVAATGFAELEELSAEFAQQRAEIIEQSLLQQGQMSPAQPVRASIVRPQAFFAAPPSEFGALSEFLSNLKEIPRECLLFGKEIGSGEFGAVFEGGFVSPTAESGTTKVAIKLLKRVNLPGDLSRFLKEAAIMAQFDHPNILSLVGVCTRPPGEPTLIVLEYMHLGALHGYLQSPLVRGRLQAATMLHMALDVAAGMSYLADAGFVHRDLAARNVLLDKSMRCRIGDFGLSVSLGADAVYSDESGARMPVRWCSLEALLLQQFSTASDVWAYGVLLWEIWSYAELPYKGWGNKRVIEEVCNGARLPCPLVCPNEVYKLMLDCWNTIKRRTTFPRIVEALHGIWNEVVLDAEHEAMIDDGLYDNRTPGNPTAPTAPTLPALYSFGDTDVYPLADASKTDTMTSQSRTVYDNPGGAPQSTIVNVYDFGTDPAARTLPTARSAEGSASPVPPPRTHSPMPSVQNAPQGPTAADSTSSHYLQPQSSSTSLVSANDSLYLQPAPSSGTYYESLHPQLASSVTIPALAIALHADSERGLLSPVASSLAGTALTSLAPSPVPFPMAGQPPNADHNYESLAPPAPQQSPPAQSSYEYSDSEEIQSVRSAMMSSFKAAHGGGSNAALSTTSRFLREYSNPEGSEMLAELAGIITGQSTSSGLPSPSGGTPQPVAASINSASEYSNPEENEESGGRYESLTPQASAPPSLKLGQRMVPSVRTASPLRNSLAPPLKASPRPRSGSRPAPPPPPPPPPPAS